jgi:hypothetical protein
MNKTAVTTFALAAVLAGSLAACSGSNTIAPPAPAASQAAPATPTPTQQYAADFGGSVTYPGGVKVSVSQPTVVQTSATAYKALDGKAVVTTVTVTNGSKDPVNASLMGFPRLRYGADGVEAVNVTDVEQHIGDGSLSTILPGETQSVKLGYAVPPEGYSQVRVEVNSPTYSDQPAIFKGAIK